MDVVYSCSSSLAGESRIERLKNITDALFEAAEKTKEGAGGLVMMSDSANKGLDHYSVINFYSSLHHFKLTFIE